MKLWLLTKVGLASGQGAVLVGRAEGSIAAILVVAAGEDTLAVLASGGGVRRLAGAGVDLAVVSRGVDGGGQVMRSTIDDGGGAVDHGHGGCVSGGGLSLIVDGNPGGSLVGSLLDDNVALLVDIGVADDRGRSRGHEADRGEDLGRVHDCCGDVLNG